MGNKLWKDNNLLDEKMYKKTTPRYWHGSAYDTWNKDVSYWRYFYLSNSFEYAMTYAHKENRDFGYMYLCRLTRPLNIFNPRGSRDFHTLVKYLSGDYNDKDTSDYVSDMIDTDWLTLFEAQQRNSLIDALIDLGYDGFFSYEGDKKVGLKPAIGVFDPNDIEIAKVYNADNIREIIENDHEMKNHRDEQKHSYLRGDIDKSSEWRKISLLEQGDFVERKSRDELKRRLDAILDKKDKLNK